MFTLLPLPPKDYVLRDVNQNQRSVQEHTPSAWPRITQSNFGKFCAPVHYGENEKFANLEIDFSVNPQILQRWADKERCFWVDKPGKNAYFLHDIFKKYSVQVSPSYDVRFKHNERVFYRSFKFELDCIEVERLRKLRNKVAREENAEREKMGKIEEGKIARTDPSAGLKSCKLKQPFWWSGGGDKDCKEECVPSKISPPTDATTTSQRFRWQEEPDLMKSGGDPCQRRLDMALIGLPFRNEACNWYYKTYPPPSLRFS